MKRELGVVVDWETTGITNTLAPWMAYLEGPQGIEIGATLVFLPTFEIIAEFSSRVKFLGTHRGITYGGPIHKDLTWAEDAERVHGIKVTDLIDAPHPIDVAKDFVNFVKSNGKIADAQKNPVMFCGHNPVGDFYSTRQLLYLGGAETDLRFHHRMIDSFSLGYFTLGIKNSNELFERTSNKKRGIHSAMEDSRLTTAALRTIYQLCQQVRK